eukprot:TRINITY_DN20876_c0_g1_i1.p1 TRINITY_DN20876_c0_g1~~TRINITY_DN20876_c0_g1_i1.p1  ORF type:complete len:327 (+),score=98.10 TRINITY_DN20876_c0_g1_i1:110-1090(+)
MPSFPPWGKRGRKDGGEGEKDKDGDTERLVPQGVKAVPASTPPGGGVSRGTEKEMRKLQAEGITRAQSPPTPAVAPVPVYVNVYNLMPPDSNAKFSMLGVGIYHSGVDVYGEEWTFGGSREAVAPERSGIFAVPPKRAVPSLHSSVLVGEVRLTREQVRWIIKGLERTWTMASYQLLSRNCNHFAEEFVAKLGLPFPSWINRAAKISNALIPNSLLDYIMKSLPQPPPEEGDYNAAPPPRTHSHTHGGRPCAGHSHSHGSRGGDNGARPASPPPAEAPPPIPADLASCTVRQLRTIMFVRGISWEGCIEKGELIDKIREYEKAHPA